MQAYNTRHGVSAIYTERSTVTAGNTTKAGRTFTSGNSAGMEVRYPWPASSDARTIAHTSTYRPDGNSFVPCAAEIQRVACAPEHLFCVYQLLFQQLTHETSLLASFSSWPGISPATSSASSGRRFHFPKTLPESVFILFDWWCISPRHRPQPGPAPRRSRPAGGCGPEIPSAWPPAPVRC